MSRVIWAITFLDLEFYVKCQVTLMVTHSDSLCQMWQSDDQWPSLMKSFFINLNFLLIFSSGGNFPYASNTGRSRHSEQFS